MQDERASSSNLKRADEPPVATDRYDRGVLLLMRGVYLVIVTPLFIVTLCFWLPAWCWRIARTRRKL